MGAGIQADIKTVSFRSYGQLQGHIGVSSIIPIPAKIFQNKLNLFQKDIKPDAIGMFHSPSQ